MPSHRVRRQRRVPGSLPIAGLGINPIPTTLSIVATPIGNLGDLSPRAVETLRQAEIILCEDTRVTRKLLAHAGITAPLLWRLRESEGALEHLARSLAGKRTALVTDSGTPCVSDPGSRLISSLMEKIPDLRVIPIPGPSALTAALCVSGMGRDGFIFLGFLGRSPSKIVRELGEALRPDKAVIFYESPYRILRTLKILAERWPQAKLTAARELTKQFEQILRGTPASVLESLQAQGIPRGEFTIVVEIR